MSRLVGGFDLLCYSLLVILEGCGVMLCTVGVGS